MKLRFIFAALWSACWAPAQPVRCGAVDGDRLEARHLAEAIPAFRVLPPDTPIAPAPAPGARRVFQGAELLAVAKRFSVPLAEPPDVCFEWELQPVDRALALEAMKAAFPDTTARIEVVETSLYPAPRGSIEFRREGLGRPANPAAPAPVLWRGSVLYGDHRRFPIWARVLVTVKLPRVIAAQALKRGVPVEPEQLRVDSVEGFPLADNLARTIEEVVGKAPWQDIPADSPVRISALTQPPEIGRGDMVEVEVRAGAARLAFTAKAESSGRNGQTVNMRNTYSNRIFAARVSGKRRAVVELGAQP